MITEFIFDIIKNLINGLLALMPIINLPAEMFSGLVAVLELFYEASIIVPINIILVCIGWFVLMYNTNFVMSIVNWILRRFPTQS